MIILIEFNATDGGNPVPNDRAFILGKIEIPFRQTAGAVIHRNDMIGVTTAHAFNQRTPVKSPVSLGPTVKKIIKRDRMQRMHEPVSAGSP